jgi:DNA-binding YbaB/EbfC family protein
MDIMKMLQQAQQMQADLQRQQEQTQCTHTANGVSVVARGDYSIVAIDISDEVATSGDAEMIQDLVLVATNGALEKVREQMSEKMNGMAQNMGLPGMPGM